jgi:hypothetical protein
MARNSVWKSAVVVAAILGLIGVLANGVMTNWKSWRNEPITVAPATSEPKPAGPSQTPSAATAPNTIRAAASNNRCSFRDEDFVQQKTEYQVTAICTGLTKDYEFTANFVGVIKPDNAFHVGDNYSGWVDMWLTDSHEGTKAVGQSNFSRRLDNDYINPHQLVLRGTVPPSGEVTVYLVLDHCQTHTYLTTCSTIGNSQLLITATPKM